MEDPLYQDGDDPTPAHGALTRLTVHDARTGRPIAQYAYPLEPLFVAPPTGSTDTNGVSDLVALGHDRFLLPGCSKATPNRTTPSASDKRDGGVRAGRLACVSRELAY
ncbi:esterase-like activity of phytase family protein [Streptomyces sp. NPDC002491]